MRGFESHQADLYARHLVVGRFSLDRCARFSYPFCTMPDCKNCSSSFPTRLKVNGVIRVLASRQYCFECSPFKSRNTRQLHKPHTPLRGSSEISCAGCSRVYVFDSIQRKGHTKKFCNSCTANRSKFSKRQTLIDEAGGKCQRCGYSRNLGALQFHHRDPALKLFTVSGSYNLSLARLRAESAKCDLVCANCHAEVEWPHLNMYGQSSSPVKAPF